MDEPGRGTSVGPVSSLKGDEIALIPSGFQAGRLCLDTVDASAPGMSS